MTLLGLDDDETSDCGKDVLSILDGGDRAVVYPRGVACCFRKKNRNDLYNQGENSDQLDQYLLFPP